MVKSNSLRATKSIAGAPAPGSPSASHRDLGADQADLQRSGSRPSAPRRPSRRRRRTGSRCAARPARSPWPAAATSARLDAGAAARRSACCPRTRAAGWASQVGIPERLDLALAPGSASRRRRRSRRTRAPAGTGSSSWRASSLRQGQVGAVSVGPVSVGRVSGRAGLRSGRSSRGGLGRGDPPGATRPGVSAVMWWPRHSTPRPA